MTFPSRVKAYGPQNTELSCLRMYKELLLITFVWTILRRYNPGQASVTISCRNSPSHEVFELKDKINPMTLNYVIFVGTWSKKESWVRRASRLCFAGWRAYIKKRQTNNQMNVNFCRKLFVMWCDRCGTLLWCFCVWNAWNVNKCVWIL